MSKSVQNVKNSLKFKANEKAGVLSVRVGVKKFVLPVGARLLQGGEYLFLSFSASSELYKIDGKTLNALPKDSDASVAYEALNPGRRRRRRKEGTGKMEMPATLVDALKSLPAGHKIGYGPDGTPKLVKARRRRSTKE